MNKITEALEKLFTKHRVIFWYDEKQELVDQFADVDLVDVIKLHVQNDEFQIKHNIVIQNPDKNFLLYFTKEKPENEDNWLLDLELAHHVFHTDQEAMFLHEMGLGYHLKDLVSSHIEFFKSKERRVKLKEYLGDGDSFNDIRYKMLAIMFGTENINLATYIHTHGSSFVDGNEKYEKDLDRYNLSDFYWSEIHRKFNYQSTNPTVYDFLLEVFNNNFVHGTKTNISKESRLLLSLWKDTIRFREYFGLLSEKISSDIDVEGKLNHSEIDEIWNDDLFKLVDYKIIHSLVIQISNETISVDRVNQIVKQRENKFWYREVDHLYNCLQVASQLIQNIRKHSNKTYSTFNEGIHDYSNHLYEIDLQYRKFIWSYRKSGQNRILSELANKIEKIYSNDWLLTYNDNWQTIIDQMTNWDIDSTLSQTNFFNRNVKPIAEKNQRIFVIISDALRYECGVELTKRLQSENRFEAQIQPMVSNIPSYTQLCMASLLPHSQLRIQEGTDLVNVDGISSSGIQGRSKILHTLSGDRSTAINATDFMKMNSSKEGREFVKNYDVIYIYHNRIDKTGDDKTTEEKVFDVVEEELLYLLEILKKINNMNGYNMIITSDHGFVYQHHELDESDFTESTYSGTLWKENRRFIIGKEINSDKSTKHFRGQDLSLNDDIDVLFPKSINRLRIKGSGSRFVHGGTTLQEIIVPLIKITKTRQDTTSQVEIDIIKSTDKITTNILPVSFIQINLVSDQVLPRTIRAVIKTEDGEEISDQFRFNFDIDNGSERQREVKHRFQLSSKASGKYKNQRVKLVLEEPLEGTSKWKPYKDYFYTLNISFTNDFDEF